MSKTRTIRPTDQNAHLRAGIINGIPSEAIAHGVAEQEVGHLIRDIQGSRHFVCIQERHGKRQLRLTSISQVIYDQGQVGGPWFIRCDGQQLPVSAENAQKIAAMLGLNLEEAKV